MRKQLYPLLVNVNYDTLLYVPGTSLEDAIQTYQSDSRIPLPLDEQSNAEYPDDSVKLITDTDDENASPSIIANYMMNTCPSLYEPDTIETLEASIKQSVIKDLINKYPEMYGYLKKEMEV